MADTIIPMSTNAPVNPISNTPTLTFEEVFGTTTISIPPEFKTLNDTLYKEISSLIAGGRTLDLRKDPSTIRIIAQSAIKIVETYRDPNNVGLEGPKKRMLAISLANCVMYDLAKAGVIDPVFAKELIDNSEFYFGTLVDIAVAGANGLIFVSQKLIEKVQLLSKDAETVGCAASCKKNCCGCCVF